MSDWSSDVCSSDLPGIAATAGGNRRPPRDDRGCALQFQRAGDAQCRGSGGLPLAPEAGRGWCHWRAPHHPRRRLYAEGCRGVTYRRPVSRKLARGLALVGLVGTILLLAAVVFFYSLTFDKLPAQDELYKALLRMPETFALHL